MLSTIVAMHPNMQIEVPRSMELKKTSNKNLVVIRTNELPAHSASRIPQGATKAGKLFNRPAEKYTKQFIEAQNLNEIS